MTRLYQRGLRLCVHVYKGLYISLLKNCYCITYYTAIIAELRFPVNYFWLTYSNTLNLLHRQMQLRLVDARPPGSDSTFGV